MSERTDGTTATALTDEELDRRVATDVMEWETCNDPKCGGCDAPVCNLGMGLWKVLNPDTGEFFCPSTNASHDYEVLCYVRETWSKLEQWSFATALLGNLSRVKNEACPVCVNYRPGDYAKAAGAALEAAEKEKP